MPDQPGHVATTRDTIYSLTVEQAATLYARAGHPRTLRTVQRYCASGHLDCVKEATMLGDKYFVERGSVTRHLAQIEELISLDSRSSGRDEPRLVASRVGAQPSRDDQRHHLPTYPTVSPPAGDGHRDDRSATEPDDTQRQPATPDNAASRPAATTDIDTSRYVAQLEIEVERAQDDREFLREQIKTKDVQIAALLERDRETNILVGSLQRMLAPLLGPSRREPRDDVEYPSI